jgi:hypothetical protein
LSDGSFPIPNKKYLGKALQAVGRAAAGKRPVLAKLIRKRARQLGAWNVVKGSWADNTQGATAMANALRVKLVELGYSPIDAQREVRLTMPYFALELAGKSSSSDDPDNDGDDDSSDSGDTDGDYAGSALYKKVFAAMKKRSMSDAAAKKMAMNACKRAKKAGSGKASAA